MSNNVCQCGDCLCIDDARIEPTLGEALDDPVIRLLMARDGVTRGDLDLLIRSTRHTGLAGRSPTQH